MFYGKTTNMFGVHSYAKISVVAYGIPHSLDQKKNNITTTICPRLDLPEPANRER